MVVVHIFKNWQMSEDPSKNVACLMGNCDQGDFVQLSDIDVKCGVDVGDIIFSLFLRIPNSCLTSIIKLKPCAMKHSAYL